MSIPLHFLSALKCLQLVVFYIFFRVYNCRLQEGWFNTCYSITVRGAPSLGPLHSFLYEVLVCKSLSIIFKHRFGPFFLTLTKFPCMCPHSIIHSISIYSDSTICYHGLSTGNSKMNKLYSLLLRSSKSSGSDTIKSHIFLAQSLVARDTVLNPHKKPVKFVWQVLQSLNNRLGAPPPRGCLEDI